MFSIFLQINIKWKEMVEGLMKLVAKELRKLADKFDAGTTEASESQVMDIMSMLTHVPMSKAQAYEYLNMSRSRFDDLVRERKLPNGRKSVGFKEIVFYKDELDLAVQKMKHKGIKVK